MKKWQSSLNLNGYILKNRIIFPPIGSNLSEEDGSISKRNMEFYDRISRGGSSMVVVEGTAVSPEGKGTKNCPYLNENTKKSFEDLSDLITSRGCLPSIQLFHAGGQANPNFTGLGPVSPSGLECKSTGFCSRALSKKEINELKNKFVNCARLAYKSGFEAVELHLAHGYLLHEFLSEHSNKRTDNYGGGLSSRIELILEIIDRIKQTNPDKTLGARISGEDYVLDGLNFETNKIILPLLETQGINYFSVTAGIYETSKMKHQAMKAGRFFEYSRQVKGLVSAPVISVGKILDLDMAEYNLVQENCDLVAIGRGQIADPNLVNKTEKGKVITKCIECEECMYLRHGRSHLSCKVNEFLK